MANAIIIPTDGSKHSIKSIEFALTMLQKEDEIVLVNVQSPSSKEEAFLSKEQQEALHELYIQEGQKLIDQTAEILINRTIPYKAEIRLGTPSIEITEVAKKYKAKSIVMGTRGMGPVFSRALGSVSYGVLHLARCPVTFVPIIEE